MRAVTPLSEKKRGEEGRMVKEDNDRVIVPSLRDDNYFRCCEGEGYGFPKRDTFFSIEIGV